MFRTPEEETRELAKEIRELKDILREISRKLGQIEGRVKRVFPTAFPSLPSQGVRTSVPKINNPPTISSQEALNIYDELVKMAKEGRKDEVQRRLETMGLPDLAFLSRELGVPVGKNKPSRKVLLNGVLGRISESMMLSTSNLRERINNQQDTEKTNPAICPVKP